MIGDVTGLSSSNIVVSIPNDSYFMWGYDETTYGEITTVKEIVKRKMKFKYTREFTLKVLRPAWEWTEKKDDIDEKHSYLDLLNKFAQITGCIHFYENGKYYFVSRDYSFLGLISKPSSYLHVNKIIAETLKKKKMTKYNGIKINFSNNIYAYIKNVGGTPEYYFSLYENADQILLNDGSTNYYVTYIVSYITSDTKRYLGFVSTTDYISYNRVDDNAIDKVLEININEPYSAYFLEADPGGIPDYQWTSGGTDYMIFVSPLQGILESIFANYLNILNYTYKLSFTSNMKDNFPIWVASYDNSLNLFPSINLIYNVMRGKIDFIQDTTEVEVDI